MDDDGKERQNIQKKGNQSLIKRFIKGCTQVCVGLVVVVIALGVLVEFIINKDDKKETVTTPNSAQEIHSLPPPQQTEEQRDPKNGSIEAERIPQVTENTDQIVRNLPSPQQVHESKDPTDGAISAETLAKAFLENKELAKSEYKDRALLISGEVKSATPGAFSGAYFVMTTVNGDLQFDFPDNKSIEPLQDVYIGDIIQVSGKFDRVSEKYIEISNAVFDRVITPSSSRGEFAVIEDTKKMKIDAWRNIVSKTISMLSDHNTRFNVTIADESSTSTNSFNFRINYKDRQNNIRSIEIDCRTVVKTCLDILVAEGRRPASEWINVSATGWYPHKGATGENVITTYGRARYNYNNDSIRFEQAK